MIRFLLTYLCFLSLLLACSHPVYGQVDTLDTTLSDTTRTDSTLADTTQAPAEPTFRIIPWKKNYAIDAQKASGDSLMRWQNWPVWTFKKNRDPGVLSFRLGTVGRSSSLMIDAHEPRHQQLLWEDIPMQNRVSGTINWNVIPIHKVESIYEEGNGITHSTNFYLKEYYVNQPMSRLIFDESKFDRRALEFWITQNFTQKTNAEISYRDRRGGGGFPRSSFTGSQIYGRVYHQMDNTQFFKVRFLNSSRNLNEPFGYNIPDLGNYTFNRFSTSPNQSNAASESTFNTLAVSYHRRPADSTAVPEKFRAGLYMDNQKREVSYSADTTYYKIRTLGMFAHKWLDWSPLKVEGLLRYELFLNKERDRSSLETGNWGLATGTGNIQFKPFPWISLDGEATYKYRDDGFSSYSLGGDVAFNLADRVSLTGGVSRGSLMPTPQQLYWNSAEYSGSTDLAPEKILEAHASTNVTILDGLNVGAKGQYKQVTDAAFLNTENQFVNVPEYESVSATGFSDFTNQHIELSASATAQQYLNAGTGMSNNMPAFNTTRIWFKGGAYWKGYLFDRATYLKAGLSGMFSPMPYQSEHYNAALDFWQPASTDQQLPWYSRLDVDISARVRSIMFVMRFENVLDDVNQLGYFETAGYPMPPRRFLFGVRAVFNN
ncbi:MAG: putative porin [Balneolaceae bacterium]|nr:putative porin [Balneolaceae bacterium]